MAHSPRTAHHRFTVRGSRGHLAVDVGADLAAPWTLMFGPSASGKSTVLQALAGLVPGLEGSFDRFSSAVGGWQPLSRLPSERRHLAYHPQRAPLLPHLTTEENIRFPERLRGTKPSASHFPEITDLLQLEPLLSRPPHLLSGGERQRVSLARALCVPDACLLLLDEPFTGLDRALRDVLVPRLQAHLRQRALPVLSVTHDPDEALLLQAEVLRISNGRLIAQGEASRILADEVDRLVSHLRPQQERAPDQQRNGLLSKA